MRAHGLGLRPTLGGAGLPLARSTRAPRLLQHAGDAAPSTSYSWEAMPRLVGSARTRGRIARAQQPEGALPAPEASASGAAAAAALPAAGAEGQAAKVQGNPLWQALTRALASVWALLSSIKQFPAWVQQQQLQRLREQCEEDPRNADRHAALLAALNAQGAHAQVGSSIIN
jgi:hypothetical protein